MKPHFRLGLSLISIYRINKDKKKGCQVIFRVKIGFVGLNNKISINKPTKLYMNEDVRHHESLEMERETQAPI